MNALLIAGFMAGEALAVARKSHTFAIVEELISSPKRFVDNVYDVIKDDVARVKGSGVGGAIIGTGLAAATIPVAALTVPSSMAARAAQACESTPMAVMAGIGGFTVGTLVMAHTAEIGLLYHWTDGLCAVGHISEKAKKKAARRAKQAKAKAESNGARSSRN